MHISIFSHYIQLEKNQVPLGRLVSPLMDEAARRVSVVGRIMAAYPGHALVLSPCEYVTLCGKREFADVIELRVLRWGQYPGVIRCSL